MDADLQHPPEKILDIYKNLEKNDLVVASRKAEGGGVEKWPWYRRIVSKGAELLSKILLKESKQLKDPLSGFFGLYYLISNLIGVLISAIWNFSMNTLYT